jgi:hypothetical protein
MAPAINKPVTAGGSLRPNSIVLRINFMLLIQTQVTSNASGYRDKIRLTKTSGPGFSNSSRPGIPVMPGIFLFF